MDEPTIVRGPLAPSPGSGVVYQVTLANGQIVTRPEGWQENRGALRTEPAPTQGEVPERPEPDS